MVRSIAIDSLGCIYIGLDDDFGKMQSDVNGDYHYHSLKDKIPEINRNFSMMNKIIVLGNEVIFTTSKNLFIYQNGKLRILSDFKNYPWPFLVNNRYYVREYGKGIFYLENDSLRIVGGNEGFAKMAIIAALPYRQNEIYNPTLKFDIDHPFNTLIREVYSKDSLLFGGERFGQVDFRYLKGKELPYIRNNLIFQFTATNYEDSERNMFSYRLLESDSTWSAWANDQMIKKRNTPTCRRGTTLSR